MTNTAPSATARTCEAPAVVPDLRQLRADQRDYFDRTVTDGRGQMPAWGGILTDADFDNLWAYIRAQAR